MLGKNGGPCAHAIVTVISGLFTKGQIESFQDKDGNKFSFPKISVLAEPKPTAKVPHTMPWMLKPHHTPCITASGIPIETPE